MHLPTVKVFGYTGHHCLLLKFCNKQRQDMIQLKLIKFYLVFFEIMNFYMMKRKIQSLINIFIYINLIKGIIDKKIAFFI